MATMFHNFDEDTKPIPRAKWPNFQLGGKKFTCLPELPGAMILDFIELADGTGGVKAAQAVLEFLETVVVDSDKKQFNETIRDPKNRVGIQKLMSMAEWVVKTYSSGRPLEQSAPLSVSRVKTGRISTGAGSTRASK